MLCPCLRSHKCRAAAHARNPRKRGLGRAVFASRPVLALSSCTKVLSGSGFTIWQWSGMGTCRMTMPHEYHNDSEPFGSIPSVHASHQGRRRTLQFLICSCRAARCRGSQRLSAIEIASHKKVEARSIGNSLLFTPKAGAMETRVRELLNQLCLEFDEQTAELRKLRQEVQRLGGVPRQLLENR